ncbi:MAG: TIGR03086 family metal-binding protein [Chloroflexota bacterium]|nr:TIGR03086 family protein [Chloroflexia bacterium]MDQ3227507.1 TIGR03086 family metal-binding protein [Chloroflexota bacterium]
MSDQQQQQAPGDPVSRLRQANEVFLTVLREVRPEQMTLPTVNDGWDVRELLNHLVRGNRWTVENLRTGGAPRPTADLIGDRAPLDAYAESAEAMIAAFQEPGALGRTVQMPFGEMPGAGLAAFRFNDLLAHAWDLAKATGQNTDLAPELCEIALAASRQRLEGRDRAQSPFKDEVSVPAEACAADRLAGYLGKQV